MTSYEKSFENAVSMSKAKADEHRSNGNEKAAAVYDRVSKSYAEELDRLRTETPEEDKKYWDYDLNKYQS